MKLINNSELTIDAAIYAINNDEIVNALKKANNRGVKIRILTDRLQAAGKIQKFGNYMTAVLIFGFILNLK